MARMESPFAPVMGITTIPGFVLGSYRRPIRTPRDVSCALACVIAAHVANPTKKTSRESRITE
jgi:hypothetical protein